MSPGPGSRAMPKPEPRKRVKARKQREDVKRLRAFRDAVWAREGSLSSRGIAFGNTWARCQKCGRDVYRETSLYHWRGEVHHIIPRSRSKADRYNPDNGMIVCRPCHRLLQEHKA